MLIAHISDTHITAPGLTAYGKVDTVENFTRCISYINKMAPRPDLVVVTGDITYSGQREEVETAGLLLSRLHMPWYVVPGNHDRRSTLSSLLDRQSGDTVFRTYGDCFDYLIEDRELCLIGLDSSTNKAPGGKISVLQADWLGECLAANRERPTLLFLHHPPVKCGVLETDEDGFAGAKYLGEVVADFPCILRILCGHIHLASHVAWCGTVVTTAPSMGLQLYLDLTMQLPSAFMVEDPGFYLHYYTPRGNLVSHAVFVGKTDHGPYLFDQPR